MIGGNSMHFTHALHMVKPHKHKSFKRIWVNTLTERPKNPIKERGLSHLFA